jgi:spore germination protein
MPRIKRRRTRIRIYSFISAGFLVATGLAVTGFFMAYTLRMNIEYSYERALSELSEHLGNIDLSLQKAQYAGTNAQLVNVASGIRMESASAKNALSQIAVSNVNFGSTAKFISQTGDYANTLAQSLTENAKITATDRDKLAILYGSAEKLSRQVNDLVTDVQDGRITLFKSDEAVSDLEKDRAKTVSTVASGFQSIEDNMSSLPSLIYDGPFSDNMLKKKPELTKGKAEEDRSTARKTAVSFFGLAQKDVRDDGETAGSLPTYNFTCGTKTIYVSKKGGYVVRMLDSRAPQTAKLSTADALVKAKEFFKTAGSPI